MGRVAKAQLKYIEMKSVFNTNSWGFLFVFLGGFLVQNERLLLERHLVQKVSEENKIQ